ncbi:hypothetical protein HMPREF9371_2192 [Neisseria shayeganii 871]|uniref:Uncharacterized protein n=2 Tax=Neisseria shayeganii TaxID=607712 RepID=G4CKQ2_9NEIS|nr:hypothetical protein HMPREF9371_2192 [Neisseria shayeganii 871]
MRLFFSLAAACAALSVALFYGLPQWLQARQIEAAAADVRLLNAEEPPPAAGQRNVFAALWLFNHDIPPAEQEELVRRYGAAMNHSPQMMTDLAPRRLHEMEMESPACLEDTVAACISQMRSDPAAIPNALAGRERLLANIDALADYDVFHHSYWPDGHSGVESLRMPNLRPLTQEGTLYPLLLWQQQGAAAGLRQACRQMKTGRLLLQGRPGLIYPMVGSAVLRRNIDVAAHILAEQPQLAGELPDDCLEAFDPLPLAELSLCRAMRDEFRLYRQTVHDFAVSVAAERPWGWLTALQMDEAHSEARLAPHYAPACRGSAADILGRDQAWPDMPPPRQGWAQRWACIGNAAGCGLTADDMRVDFAGYVRRMQDSQMRLNAMRALIALYRLPPDARRSAAVERILTVYSTPQRQLSLHGGQLHFPLYAPPKDQKRYPPALPVVAGFVVVDER